MEFVVDRVSEDSFYENLLIGLPKILDKLPNVSNQNLMRHPPIQHNVLSAWEQKYGVLLPEDLRAFYGSINGLLYTYNFCYTEDEFEENMIIGRIEVNSLNNLIQIYGYEISSCPGMALEGDSYQLRLGPDSKVFELVNLYDSGRVVLVYLNPRFTPSIWLHNAHMKFYFLADDFTTYLKMCIHHLGIPYWQFAYTPDGIPEWSEMVFRLLSPGSLPFNNKKLENGKINNESRMEDDNIREQHINKIDPAIFKIKRIKIEPIEPNLSTKPIKKRSPMLAKSKSQLKGPTKKTLGSKRQI